MKFALTAVASFALLSSCSSGPEKAAEEKKATAPAKPEAQPAGAGGGTDAIRPRA